ncbi:hypothetical protein [Spiroplasma endosymbiont of Seladonia tumulorum]|uniref:hypothetical protein n=1 Tax=Spiroplasma endosymbiont of Seladonia tumulorum TaxID=3066321 RepID=UPI0030CAF08B
MMKFDQQIKKLRSIYNDRIYNEDFKNVLLKSYDITDDIEIIKTQLQSVYDELIKVQTVNTGGVPKVVNKENNILDTDNVFKK